MARPRYHLAASAVVGAGFFAATRNRKAAAAPLLSGFLVDLDHGVDFLLARSRWRDRLLVLPLHGWEYLLLWLVLDRVLGTRGALAAGYAVHLGIDQWANRLRHPWGYSLMVRARHRFDVQRVGPRDLVSSDHRWLKARTRDLLHWF
jgi:hypothetical protein